MTDPFNSQHNIPLAQHPLFDGNPLLWEAFSGNIHKRKFRHDEGIFSHGDDASSLWLVLSGWVKLSRQTPDGKETIAGLCAPGDTFGEAALFAHANYPYTAEAIGKQVELASISASFIRAQTGRDQNFAAKIMTMLNERNAQTQLKLEHMSTMSAAQRLGCFLLRLCHMQVNGSKTLHIPVEKYVLATYLGMKPETLSRSQQQLKPLGVNIQGEQVDIEQVSRLREFVCGSCSESGMGNCEAES